MNTPGIHACFEKRHSGGSVIRVDDCDTLAEPGITVLFGESGSGKTTFLHCIAGLERPDAGSIRFGDEIWSDADQRIFLPARRRGIGLVPQDFALFPHLTAGQNIGYGLAKIDSSARRRRIAETLEWMNLEGLDKRLPKELSGGQQQRVALARALAPRPRLLLLDEPLSSLDHPTRTRLRRELRDCLQAAQTPAILVTHDRQDATMLGDEIIVMSGGRVIQHGPVREVFSKPVSSDVADILAVEATVQGVLLAHSEGIAIVNVNGVALQALADTLPEGTKSVLACIRAEDVSLSAPGMTTASPRNRLHSIVTGIFQEGPLVRIGLDCGFRLSALLTPQGFEELALTTGCPVTATIKAPKIHLIPL